METTAATRHEAIFDQVASEAGANPRLDVFWCAHLADASVSRARVREAVEAGLATIDGAVCRKPGYKLRGGETQTLTLRPVISGASAES